MTDHGRRDAVPQVATKMTAKRKLAKGSRPPSPDTPPLPDLPDDLAMSMSLAIEQERDERERTKKIKTTHDKDTFNKYGARIKPSDKKVSNRIGETLSLTITTSTEGRHTVNATRNSQRSQDTSAVTAQEMSIGTPNEEYSMSPTPTPPAQMMIRMEVEPLIESTIVSSSDQGTTDPYPPQQRWQRPWEPLFGSNPGQQLQPFIPVPVSLGQIVTPTEDKYETFFGLEPSGNGNSLVLKTNDVWARRLPFPTEDGSPPNRFTRRLPNTKRKTLNDAMLWMQMYSDTLKMVSPCVDEGLRITLARIFTKFNEEHPPKGENTPLRSIEIIRDSPMIWQFAMLVLREDPYLTTSYMLPHIDFNKPLQPANWKRVRHALPVPEAYFLPWKSKREFEYRMATVYRFPEKFPPGTYPLQNLVPVRFIINDSFYEVIKEVEIGTNRPFPLACKAFEKETANMNLNVMRVKAVRPNGQETDVIHLDQKDDVLVEMEYRRYSPPRDVVSRCHRWMEARWNLPTDQLAWQMYLKWLLGFVTHPLVIASPWSDWKTAVAIAMLAVEAREWSVPKVVVACILDAMEYSLDPAFRLACGDLLMKFPSDARQSIFVMYSGLSVEETQKIVRKGDAVKDAIHLNVAFSIYPPWSPEEIRNFLENLHAHGLLHEAWVPRALFGCDEFPQGLILPQGAEIPETPRAASVSTRGGPVAPEIATLR